MKFLDEVASNLFQRINAEPVKKCYYSRFSFWYEIKVLQKNEFWITGLDEVITDGFNVNEMVRNSENTLTKTDHSDKGTG